MFSIDRIDYFPPLGGKTRLLADSPPPGVCRRYVVGLKNLYFDSVAFRSDILRFVMTVMPEGHVFMGTDYPFDMPDPYPVSSGRSAMPDDEASAGRILGGNLRQVLKIEERRSS